MPSLRYDHGQMKSSRLLDNCWWLSVPYLLIIGALAALAGLSGYGWAFGHIFGLFMLIGIPLVVVDLGWIIAMLYGVVVNRQTARPSQKTFLMLGLAIVAAIPWALWMAQSNG